MRTNHVGSDDPPQRPNLSVCNALVHVRRTCVAVWRPSAPSRHLGGVHNTEWRAMMAQRLWKADRGMRP